MVGFSKENARRVANATLYVEKVSKNTPSKIKGTGLQSQQGFFARITAGDSSRPGEQTSSTAKYSWEAVKHKTDLTWILDPDWGTGDHAQSQGYAVESKFRSKYVLIGDIVYLYPAKSTDGSDYYVFDYNPTTKIGTVNISVSASARVGTTLGFCSSFNINDIDGTADVLFPSANSLNVFNWTGTAVNLIASKYYVVNWSDGRWVLTGAEC